MAKPRQSNVDQGSSADADTHRATDGTVLTVWHRFRDDGDEMLSYIDWPDDCGDTRDLLVWNRCDGYHIWSRCFDVPPGTHYARLPAEPDLGEV